MSQQAVKSGVGMPPMSGVQTSSMMMQQNPTGQGGGMLAGSMMKPYSVNSPMNNQQMGASSQSNQPSMASAASMLPSNLGMGSTIPDVNGGGDAQEPIKLEDENEENMANTKEKTPMCLVNELARFNKIQHQYTLTDEQGPAHKKTFYVKLKLGDEEYAASGPSIKKAQHAAASIALTQTQYKKPPPKPPRITESGMLGDVTPTVELNALVMRLGEPALYQPLNPPRQFYPPPNFNFRGNYHQSLTPTVELNALAMKRGEPANYRPIEMPRPQGYPPNLDFRGMYNQRYHYPRYSRIFYVSLKVGQREFIGEGSTRQAARHNAAAKALRVLRALPLPNNSTATTKPAEKVEGNSGNEEEDDALKSEISLVHEIALRHNMPVTFEVTKESGPPHMRVFVTRCVCGNFTTEGEGNSKKLSKKRAAESMLEELKKLPQLSPAMQRPKKPVVNKKKSRNLIKEQDMLMLSSSIWRVSGDQLQKADPNYGQGINPISRLIQIQQAKKEKEPVYTMVAEKGLPRRKEFVMQVTVGDQVCTGTGPNKKLAKRDAAENMLQQLGYSRPSPQPSKPAIRSPENTAVSGGDKKVTFMDQEANNSRQLVPGVILMPPDSGRTLGGSSFLTSQSPGVMSRAAMGPELVAQHQATASIAKELLDTGVSPTAESMMKSKVTQSAVRPKQQLLYLADVLGFPVQFTDFPKGSNKSEYLSLVTLGTTPPQVNHGAGPTIEASHDMAALTALRALSCSGDLGIDHTSFHEILGGGDGPGVKPAAM